jgi:hypothetical protein
VLFIRRRMICVRNCAAYGETHMVTPAH